MICSFSYQKCASFNGKNNMNMNFLNGIILAFHVSNSYYQILKIKIIRFCNDKEENSQNWTYDKFTSALRHLYVMTIENSKKSEIAANFYIRNISHSSLLCYTTCGRPPLCFLWLSEHLIARASKLLEKMIIAKILL